MKKETYSKGFRKKNAKVDYFFNISVPLEILFGTNSGV